MLVILEASTANAPLQYHRGEGSKNAPYRKDWAGNHQIAQRFSERHIRFGLVHGGPKGARLVVGRAPVFFGIMLTTFLRFDNIHP